MSSLELRVARDADFYDRSLTNLRLERRQRLRFHVSDEVNNMLGRCMSADARITKRTRRELAAPWLRGKTYDMTFRDYGPGENLERTDRRIKDYLILGEGDQKLFMDEYAAALERIFPIMKGSFVWKPRLITSIHEHRTILHKWGRQPRVIVV